MDSIEQKIARRLVEAAIAKGYKISIWEGGDWAIKRSTDAEAIIKELASTDADTLVLRDEKNVVVGKIDLVWGNGEDLISDHSDNAAMNELMKGVLQ